MAGGYEGVHGSRAPLHFNGYISMLCGVGKDES